MVITLSVVPGVHTCSIICCFWAVVCSELVWGGSVFPWLLWVSVSPGFHFSIRLYFFFISVPPDFNFFSCPGILFSSLVMFFCFPLYFIFALSVGTLELCKG